MHARDNSNDKFMMEKKDNIQRVSVTTPCRLQDIMCL